jgi:uncharacterized membrane protein
MSDRTVTILCYLPVFGFIPAIIVLLSERYRSNIRMRFDAFQSLYLFLTGLVVDSIGPTMMFAGWPGGGPAHALGAMLKVALVVAWIFLLVKAVHGQQIRLPIIGDLAARSTYEQL